MLENGQLRNTKVTSSLGMSMSMSMSSLSNQTNREESDNTHPSRAGAGAAAFKEDSIRSLNIKTDDTCNNNEDEDEEFNAWVRFMNYVRHILTESVTSIATVAATHPKKTAWGIVVLSFAVAGIGYVTNFNMDTAADAMYTPKHSRIVEHQYWVNSESGFPASSRHLRLIVHNEGGDESLLTTAGVEGVFEAIDAVRSLPAYDDACATTTYEDVNGTTTCNIRSVALFWNNSVDVFRQEATSNVDAVLQVSNEEYPDGSPVDVQEIIGNAEEHYEILVHADALFVDIALPSDAEDFELQAVNRLLELRSAWRNDKDVQLGIELLSFDSLEDETTRSVYKDVPLVPCVFVIMSLFTCFIFSKRDKVKSRSLLGLGAVICVFLSLVFGYGFMFICGVPFTFLSQILPFVMFGIGLDDAFVVLGAYNRTDPRKDVVERIQESMRDIGLSIILTTVTTSVAFGLGCTSAFPCLFWLSFYAITTVVTVFFFSITFFVALISLDEQRIQENRRDCFVCFAGPPVQEAEDETVENSTDGLPSKSKNAEVEEAHTYSNNAVVRFMDSYSNFLMKPFVKTAVLIGALAFFCFAAYSTSKFKQEFNVTEMLPTDSYAKAYLEASDKYGQRGWIVPSAYFRNVDQSDPEVQQQMEDYVNDLVDIDAITTQPPLFWLRHFNHFLTYDDRLLDLTFNQQLDIFLGNSPFKELFGPHIVRDEETGDIIASRCILYMDNVNVNSVASQLQALNEQRSASMAQPVNTGVDDFNFFAWEHSMFVWDFYASTTDELIVTTILGVTTVCVIGFAFVPHWSAVLFIFPFISILYIDLMGWLQMTGNHLNVVSYFSLIIGLGLLVDFLMHMLLRYHESPGETREEKVKSALRTMGVSILVGGLSTMLGVLPLAFSSSNLMRTVFVGFFGMVSLGLTHGLMVLPVVLSLVGPTASTKEHTKKVKQMKEADAPTIDPLPDLCLTVSV